MKRMLGSSLQRKFIGIVLLTTLAALLVALVAIISYDLRAYHRGWISDIDTQAELLGQTTASAIAFDDPKTGEEYVELLRLRPQIQAAAIYTAKGALFASYTRQGEVEAFPPLPEAEGLRIEAQRMVLYKRIVSQDEILGTVYIRADYEIYGRILDYLGIALFVIFMSMLVALGMSTQLQRIITRPILLIADIARDVVQQADYTRRAVKLSDDEVGVLADSFNEMLAEIQRRTGELEVANGQLELQIRERDRAEQEVSRLNAELEDRVLDRTAQLEAANQELEAFSYTVSHDLRAPLRAIDGFSEALVEDFPDSAPEQARRYLSRIRSATMRMSQLIEDLLNLSRVSRVPLERVDVDLGDVVRQVVENIRLGNAERDVEVSIWEGIVVSADPRLLRAALENLIGNSWKFTEKVERPKIEIGTLRDGEHIITFVKDNGAGFDMKYADQLFKAFQRLHSGNEYAGTGIGLATVQRIVRRHGGRIWADARVGQGATFYFTLTASQGSGPEVAAAG